MTSPNPPAPTQSGDVVPKIESMDGTAETDLDVDMSGGQTNEMQASSSTVEGDAAASFNHGGSSSAARAGNEEGDNNGAGGPQTAIDANAEQGRMPVRKDISMRELLSKMDNYNPVVSLCISCALPLSARAHCSGSL